MRIARTHFVNRPWLRTSPAPMQMAGKGSKVIPQGRKPANKADFAQELATRLEIEPKAALALIDILRDAVVALLACHGEVSVKQFLTLYRYRRPGRAYTHPLTGAIHDKAEAMVLRADFADALIADVNKAARAPVDSSSVKGKT